MVSSLVVIVVSLVSLVPGVSQAHGNEGCTPGFWKNHLGAWEGFSPSDDFDTVFGVDAFTPDITLLQALNRTGGGLNALARHAVAALLNAAHPDVDYPLTTNQVIQLVQQAVASGNFEAAKEELRAANELGCTVDR